MSQQEEDLFASPLGGPSNSVAKRKELERSDSREDKDTKDKKLKGAGKAAETKAANTKAADTRAADTKFADTRLTALMTNFLDEEFQVEEPIDAKTRQLLIKFGVAAHKHFTTKENENLVASIGTQMNEGFQKVYEKLTEMGKGNQAAADVADSTKAKSYASALLAERRNNDASSTANGVFTVLQPKANAAPSEHQAREWQDVLSRKQRRLKFGVNNIHVTKAKNLAISFKSTEEQQRFTDEIRRNPIQGAEIRSSGDKPVHFAVRGVPAVYAMDELEEELREMNARHPYMKLVNDGIETLTLRDARSEKQTEVDTRMYKTVKLTTSMKYAKILLDNEYLQLLWKRVQVTVWKTNERCGKCLEKNHRAINCDKYVCKHCGEGHLSYMCRNRNKPENQKCVVCLRAGKNHNHRAEVGACPILKEEAMDSVERTVATIMANHHG